jgi:hypothetical protein
MQSVCLCLCDKGKPAKAASSAQGVSDEMYKACLLTFCI